VIEISSSVPPNERLLLKCVLQNEDARTAVMHYLKQSGIANTLHLKHIFNAMLSMEAETEDFTFGGLIRRLEAREQKIVSELSFKHTDMSAEEAAGQALQCLRALETKNTENRRADLRRRIRSAESEGDLKEALRLADELRR
jgi:predicted DNA-binding ribbon-helix-helix protein